MSSLKTLANQTLIYGISSLIGRSINFLLIPLYTRKFVPDQYGIVGELYAYVAFLLIILTFGLETGYFRFIQSEKDKDLVYSSILSYVFIAVIIFIAVIFFFINPITTTLRYENYPVYIKILAIIIAIDAFSAIPFAKLRYQNKALRFAKIKIINILINLGLNLIFLIGIPKLYTIYHSSMFLHYFIIDNMVIYVFISNLIASIVTILLLIPEIFIKKYQISGKLLKRILIYSFPLVLAGLAGQTNELLDRILLKFYVNVPTGILDSDKYIRTEIGIYVANFKLAVIISLFIQAFRYAFEPMFFSESNKVESKILYARVMKYFIIFCVSVFLVITLFIDIFKHFIGVEYHVGLKIVPIVLLANIFLGILFNLSLWYKLTDKTHFGIIIAGFGALITIVCNIIFIPSYSYIGSAWTHLICYICMVILSYIFMQKYYPVKYDILSISIYFVIALGIYFISIKLSIKILFLKFIINGLLLISFIIFVILKEKLLNYILKYASKYRK